MKPNKTIIYQGLCDLFLKIAVDGNIIFTSLLYTRETDCHYRLDDIILLSIRYEYDIINMILCLV